MVLTLEFLESPSRRYHVKTGRCQRQKSGLVFCSWLSPSLLQLEAPGKRFMKWGKLPCSRPDYQSPFLSHRASPLGQHACCLQWQDKAGAKSSRWCAEPWIFLKDALQRIFFFKKMRLWTTFSFWVYKEGRNNNGLKPQPGFFFFFCTWLYSSKLLCSREKRKKIAGVVTLWVWSSVRVSGGGFPRPLSVPSCTGRCYWWSMSPVIPQLVVGSGSAYLLWM